MNPLRFVDNHPIWALAVYGLLATALFLSSDIFRKNTYVHVIYLSWLVGLILAADENFAAPTAYSKAFRLVGGVIIMATNLFPVVTSVVHLLERTVRHGTGSADTVFTPGCPAGERALAEGDPKHAADCFRTHIEKHPSDFAAQMHLVDALLQLGMTADAAQAARASAEQSKETGHASRALWRWAEIVEQTGDAERTVQAFHEVVERYPKSREARYARLRLHEDTPGREESA